MSEQKQVAEVDGYGILELMGHRRLGGYIREATLAGGAFLRIDIPKQESPAWETNAPPPASERAFTAFYPPHSVYALTPVSGLTAKIVARTSTPDPVTRWDVQDAGYRVLPAARDAEVRTSKQEDELPL